MARCSRAMPGSGRRFRGPEEPAVDFVVQGPEIHGVPGLVNLYGIESPGLTASMPLAKEVVRQLALSPAEQPGLVSQPEKRHNRVLTDASGRII